MKLSRIFHGAKRALETEQGRQTAGRFADKAADVARRTAGEKHSAKIDKAHGAANRYLNRDDPPRDLPPQDKPPTDQPPQGQPPR